MSEIVTAARAISEDPAIDGLGHHNPQLGQEDDLFYNTLAINWFMEGFFWASDLSTNETQFFRLMRMGVMDMVIFRTILLEILVFFTFTLLTLHFAY